VRQAGTLSASSSPRCSRSTGRRLRCDPQFGLGLATERIALAGAWNRLDLCGRVRNGVRRRGSDHPGRGVSGAGLLPPFQASVLDTHVLQLQANSGWFVIRGNGPLPLIDIPPDS
jgi:hypothetical protein